MLDKNISRRITVFGFLMTCLIVGVHTTATGSGFQTVPVNGMDSRMNDLVESFFVQGTHIAMRFFFMTTGFLLFRNLSFQNLGHKLRKRVHSLLIPYLLWQVIAIAHNALLGFTQPVSELLQKTFLLGWCVNGPLWYVYVVFLLALLSPALLICFQNQKVGAAVILVLCMGLYSWDGGALRDYGVISNVLYYLPAYLLGAFFGHFYRDDQRDSSIKFCFYLLAGAACWEILRQGSFSYLAGNLFPLFILLYLPVSERIAGLPVYQYSFLMYATQVILGPHIMPTVYRFMNHVMPWAFLRNLLGRLTCIGFCYLGCLIFYEILVRLAPRILSVLLGGRIEVPKAEASRRKAFLHGHT